MASLEFHGVSQRSRSRRFREFEAAIADVLRDEDLGTVRVRFLPHSREGDDGRYLCQVYAGSTGVFVGTPAWVWWSGPFRTADELRADVQRALRLAHSML